MSKQVLVPIVVDEANLNPQSNNVRELLSRWQGDVVHFHTFAYGEPDPRVTAKACVTVNRLWRRHLWQLHVFISYIKQYDCIFYPGVYPADFAGLRWRRLWGYQAPVIATLEGLLGDGARESEYARWAGHPVYCQPVAPERLAAIDHTYLQAEKIIAISPFLARMGARRFGEKFLVLPLGINPHWYYPAPRQENLRVRVVAAGGVRSHKRPELFLQLAERHRECDFIWYGEGDQKAHLQKVALEKELRNLRFPGALPPAELGAAFRQADIFVLPSCSEGVPKVTQEAAACGLAQVIFGYYEAPSVVDGINGLVAWSDEEWFEKTARLIADRQLTRQLGAAGADLARHWDWQRVAGQWQSALTAVLRSSG